MKDNRFKWIILSEIAALFVFGSIAYLFNKWWIVLFSALWIKSYSYTTRMNETENKGKAE